MRDKWEIEEKYTQSQSPPQTIFVLALWSDITDIVSHMI